MCHGSWCDVFRESPKSGARGCTAYSGFLYPSGPREGSPETLVSCRHVLARVPRRPLWAALALLGIASANVLLVRLVLRREAGARAVLPLEPSTLNPEASRPRVQLTGVDQAALGAWPLPARGGAADADEAMRLNNIYPRPLLARGAAADAVRSAALNSHPLPAKVPLAQLPGFERWWAALGLDSAGVAGGQTALQGGPWVWLWGGGGDDGSMHAHAAGSVSSSARRLPVPSAKHVAAAAAGRTGGAAGADLEAAAAAGAAAHAAGAIDPAGEHVGGLPSGELCINHVAHRH